MINNQVIIEDEIDIKPYIIAVFKNYKLYIGAIFIAFLIAFILEKTLTKKYQATVTFIIPNNAIQSSSSGFPSSINAIFSKSFSTQQSNVYANYLPVIIESYRIKEHIATEIFKQGFFESDPVFETVEEKDRINYIIGFLKLSDQITLEKNIETNLFLLKYSHENQHIILPILNLYLNALILFNETLNIDAEKLQIIEIDKARFPKHPFFPNKKNIFIISLAIIYILLTVIILLNKFIKLQFNKT